MWSKPEQSGSRAPAGAAPVKLVTHAANVNKFVQVFKEKCHDQLLSYSINRQLSNELAHCLR
jgi:hypothetical protein